VAGYYTAPNGQMLRLSFSSSTTVFYFSKDAFKPPASDRQGRRLAEVVSAAAKLKSDLATVPVHGVAGWTQLESFSSWRNVEFATSPTAWAVWTPT
jgi:sn-glycerol 3-phosphate transport system substrate-binding protein